MEHVFKYCLARIVFEIRKVPIFGVRDIDIHNVAYNYVLIVHDSKFWNVALIISLVTFVLSFAALSYFFFKKGQRERLERYMRGNKLVAPHVHNALIKSSYKKEKYLELGKARLWVPESLQCLHFAFLGASGSGKSTAIEEVLIYAQRQKHKALVVDLNGAFYSKFGRPGDIILSLRDPRSEAWDFWCEKDVEPENIAAAMIEAGAEHNSYFWKGARAVLSSLLKHSDSCETLWEDFKSSTADIRKKLEDKNEISQRIIGQGDGDQADGILGTTVLDFSFLKELNQWKNPNDNKVSITEWMNNHENSAWVYLIVSDKDVEITKPLLRVWFDLACLAILGRDPGDPRNIHTWLVVDELKSIGQLPNLPALLDKGRKYKASSVLGFQAISQLEKIYGEQDTKSILQGLQNQFYFRMNEMESASYASNALGEQEIEQASLGVSFGQKTSADRGSINKTSTRKKLVLPDEIKSLKPLECYAKLCHHQPIKINFAVTNRTRINLPAQSKINKEFIFGQNKKVIEDKFPLETKPQEQSESTQIHMPLPGLPPPHVEVQP